jgi:hypothetical protein
VASWAPEPAPTTPQETLEQTLAIAEDLIRKGRTKDGLDLVRRVNDVTEQALQKIPRKKEESP